MRNRLVVLSLAVAVVLAACSKQEEPAAPVSKGEANAQAGVQEVVDAGTFFKNVPNYEGRKVYLYLERVKWTTAADVDSMDPRTMSSYGLLKFSDQALKRWAALGLDPEREYTVTFGVRATDLTGGKKAIYDIRAEDFKVNYDGGGLYGLEAPRQLGANGLPTGELKLPVPMTVKDIRQLELFPAQYADKRVRVHLSLMKSRVTPHDDKYLQLESEGALKFLVKKDLVEASFSTWPPIASVELIGKVVVNGAQTSVVGDELILLK